MIQNISIERAATPAGVVSFASRNRGWHSCLAQPPANRWHPSGMVRAAQAGGLAAISRWSRSAATIPPKANDKADCIPEGCQRRTARVDGHLKMMGAVWQ